MNRISVLALGASAALLLGAAPPSDPPPIANYWMDVGTTSGFGAGMMGGRGRPSIGQIMSMMSGGGPSVGHTLDLRLASRQKPTAGPEADHFIPPGLQMGPSLPLVTPVREEVRAPGGVPPNLKQTKGRMLLFWDCGEHVGAGQPSVIDFSKLAAGQVPPGMAAMAATAHSVAGPTSAPGFGRWPNDRDRSAVPASGSLVGAHRVEGNYSPPIAFSLTAGQDFMPSLELTEAGSLPSGATRLVWRPAPPATGYSLAMFGASGNGDVVMWSSGKNAGFSNMDYLAPSEVRRLVGLGAVLPPTTSECLLPAEVAAASPAGAITMIGYGPEANFAEKPKAPKWTAKVRFKTTATVMHGLGGFGGASARPGQPAPPPKKKKRFGLGDILNGTIPNQ